MAILGTILKNCRSTLSQQQSTLICSYVMQRTPHLQHPKTHACRFAVETSTIRKNCRLTVSQHPKMQIGSQTCPTAADLRIPMSRACRSTAPTPRHADLRAVQLTVAHLQCRTTWIVPTYKIAADLQSLT